MLKWWFYTRAGLKPLTSLKEVNTSIPQTDIIYFVPPPNFFFTTLFFFCKRKIYVKPKCFIGHFLFIWQPMDYVERVKYKKIYHMAWWCSCYFLHLHIFDNCHLSHLRNQAWKKELRRQVNFMTLTLYPLILTFHPHYAKVKRTLRFTNDRNKHMV